MVNRLPGWTLQSRVEDLMDLHHRAFDTAQLQTSGQGFLVLVLVLFCFSYFKESYNSRTARGEVELSCSAQPQPCSEQSTAVLAPSCSVFQAQAWHRHHTTWVCSWQHRTSFWTVVSHDPRYTCCWPTHEVPAGQSLVCSSGAWAPFSQICPEHLPSVKVRGGCSLAHTWELDSVSQSFLSSREFPEYTLLDPTPRSSR